MPREPSVDADVETAPRWAPVEDNHCEHRCTNKEERSRKEAERSRKEAESAVPLASGVEDW